MRSHHRLCRGFPTDVGLCAGPWRHEDHYKMWLTCVNISAAPLAQSLGDVFSAFAAALGAADKVVEMIQREPQLPGAGALQPEAFAGRLELRDVSFSYPTRPGTRVLNSISLKVNPGQVRAQDVWWERAGPAMSAP